MKTRNSEVLASLVEYCKAHPEERFWQALRNWSPYHYIYVAHFDEKPINTFYWEGKDECAK